MELMESTLSFHMTQWLRMHTLGMLSRQRIPKHRVTLFVANETERTWDVEMSVKPSASSFSEAFCFPSGGVFTAKHKGQNRHRRLSPMPKIGTWRALPYLPIRHLQFLHWMYTRRWYDQHEVLDPSHGFVSSAFLFMDLSTCWWPRGGATAECLMLWCCLFVYTVMIYY